MTVDLQQHEFVGQFPLPRTCPMHMPAQYRDAYGSEQPKKMRFWNGKDGLLFVRYEDVKAILANTKFSSEQARPDFPSISPSRDHLVANDPTFLRLDPPEHTYYRRMLTGEFMVRRITALKPKIAAIIDDLIKKMIAKGPPADFVHDFALIMTTNTITDLLGIPWADREFFNETNRLKLLTTVDKSVAQEAQQQTLEYLTNFIQNKIDHPGPGDDVITRLVNDQVVPGHLSIHMAALICDLVMGAGHETTANQISLSLLQLLQSPDQLAKLRADPSLLSNAIEEMLRLHTIVHFNALRIAVEDIEVNGTLVKAGTPVCAMITGANHDPSRFADPDRFDITRNTQGHLAFSYGHHQCLGQTLARAELEAVFSTIFDRLPNLRLACDPDTLDYKTQSIVMGVDSLPITWDA